MVALPGGFPAGKAAQALLEWFSANARDLPWRGTGDPYAILVSEVMLQQTQVDTVVPAYARWMSLFPDLGTLASASQDEVLKAWEGLGYYARALNLQRSARLIMEYHGGRVPSEDEELLALPGVGKYTAGAVQSIAYGLCRPAVDGNVERVLCRLLDIETSAKERKNQALFGLVVREMMADAPPSEVSQGLMELGALVCVPRRPRCASCPLDDLCLARNRGTATQRPVPRKRKPPQSIQAAVAILTDGERIFLQKRPPVGLMANLWEFPGGKLEAGESPRNALRRELFEELGFRSRGEKKVGTLRHAYTSFSVTLHVYLVQVPPGETLPASEGGLPSGWFSHEEARRLPMPAANVKILANWVESVDLPLEI
jgi:A/G-specific adenine glycosylase